jgi:hypothetical protein
MIAFAVTHPSWPEMVSYRAAETAGQARWDVYSAADYLGFYVKLQEFKVARQPGLDALAAKGERRSLGYKEGKQLFGDVRQAFLDDLALAMKEGA